MNVVFLSNRVIRWGFYALFALVPLLLTPWNYELFEYNKMMAVYALTAVIATSWLVKMIHEKEINITRTPLDIPIALFVGSQLVSALFSIDPHVSWFGYYSRFNGGMWSIISYVLLYYAFVSNTIDRKKLLYTTLASASVVALYGIAERMGVDKHLWVQDVQNRVFSTLGQPNWLAAYLVALVPLSFAFGLQRFRWFAVSILFFVVLLFTRSRSGLLGLAVADVVFWGMLLRKKYIKPGIILHAIFALIVLFNGPTRAIFLPQKGEALKGSPAQNGPALEAGGTESGTIRKYVWQGAINAWKSSMKTIAIGTGTETFAFAFYQYRPAAHNLTSEWDFLYNKAHNEYLNYLATTGIFGLGSYLLFIGTFIYWFIKSKKTTESIALFAGWVSILITNFFGFSVVILQVFLFLFPAMIIQTTKPLSRKLVLPSWGLWAVGVGGLLVVIRIGSFWYADTLYARGYRQARGGQYASAQANLTQAITLNPGEPVYRDEIANTLASLSVAAFETQNATLSSQFAAEALTQNDRAVRVSPKNVNVWKTRTKIYYTLSTFDPAMNSAAVTALERAAELSPNDPKIYYNLAILYGRPGENEKAVSALKKAIERKPNYRDAYYAMYIFYTEMKRPGEARLVLEDYVKAVDPNDKNFNDILTKSAP